MKLKLVVFNSPWGPQFILAAENGEILPGQVKVEVQCTDQVPSRATVTFMLEEVEVTMPSPDLSPATDTVQ